MQRAATLEASKLSGSGIPSTFSTDLTHVLRYNMLSLHYEKETKVMPLRIYLDNIGIV